MGDSVKADLKVIRDMGKGLREVHGAFKELPNLTHQYKDDFGHGELSEEFQEFSNNWEMNREKFVKEIDELAKMAYAAAEAYETIDTKLADALRDSQKSKSGRSKGG